MCGRVVECVERASGGALSGLWPCAPCRRRGALCRLPARPCFALTARGSTATHGGAPSLGSPWLSGRPRVWRIPRQLAPDDSAGQVGAARTRHSALAARTPKRGARRAASTRSIGRAARFAHAALARLALRRGFGSGARSSPRLALCAGLASPPRTPCSSRFGGGASPGQSCRFFCVAGTVARSAPSPRSDRKPHLPHRRCDHDRRHLSRV